MALKISEIIIKDRFRKKFGDMESLKESIKKIGLLQPIVIQSGTNRIVAGDRRLKACIELGMTELPDGWYRYADIVSIMEGEHDENMVREDFTPAEKVAIASALEELYKEEAQKKIAEGSKFGAKIKKEAEQGDDGRDYAGEYSRRTDVRLAEKVGWGKDTFRKAQEIVKKAQEDPENFGEFGEKLDEPDAKIASIHKQLTIKARTIERQQYDPSDELVKIANASGRMMPPFVYSALLYLPQDKQDKLVKKYGKYMLMISQACFDRSTKAHAEGVIVNMSEDELCEIIEDACISTYETVNKWVFQDQVGNVANMITNVVFSTGSEVTTFDRLEFMSIVMSMTSNIFVKYLALAHRDGTLADDSGITEETLQVLHGLTKSLDQMITAGTFDRIAMRQKKMLGGGLETFTDETRKKTNAIYVAQNMSDIDDAIAHYRTKLLNKINTTVSGASAKINADTEACVAV